MSRKALLCGCSLTKVPLGSDTLRSCTRSPSLRQRFSIIQYGKYAWPSSPLNSSTPQCDCRPAAAFDTSKRMGQSMCRCCRRSSALGGKMILSPFSRCPFARGARTSQRRRARARAEAARRSKTDGNSTKRVPACGRGSTARRAGASMRTWLRTSPQSLAAGTRVHGMAPGRASMRHGGGEATQKGHADAPARARHTVATTERFAPRRIPPTPPTHPTALIHAKKDHVRPPYHSTPPARAQGGRRGANLSWRVPRRLPCRQRLPLSPPATSTQALAVIS